MKKIIVSLVALQFHLVGISNWGSGVTGSGVSSLGKDWLSIGLNVVVANNWGSLNVLDNWLALNWGWDTVWDGLGNVDSCWDLNDLLNWLDDVIRDIVGPWDFVGLVDNVGLLLDGDDGGVDLGGSTEGSWDGNVQVWDGWLQDLSGVSGNICGGAQVNLLADLSWGLVDGGDGGSHDS